MIQFYKPNKKVTGTASSFWASADGGFWVSMIKQSAPIGQSPFAKNKDNANKKVIAKLSAVEVAGIIDTVDRRSAWVAFHESGNQKLNLSFKLVQYTNSSGEQKEGFAFSILKQDKTDSQNKLSFSIGLENSESRYLKEYLIYCLRNSFERAKNLYESSKEGQPRTSQKSNVDYSHQEKEEVNREGDANHNAPLVKTQSPVAANVDDDLW